MTKSLKVFIADDSVAIRERLKCLIAELPLAVVSGEAADGQEALKKIRELQPDVVILDIRMPLRNGIQVLQDLRGEGNFAVVIVLTTYVDSQYRVKCLQAGANVFLSKGQDFHCLREVLSEMCRGTQA